MLLTSLFWKLVLFCSPSFGIKEGWGWEEGRWWGYILREAELILPCLVIFKGYNFPPTLCPLGKNKGKDLTESHLLLLFHHSHTWSLTCFLFFLYNISFPCLCIISTIDRFSFYLSFPKSQSLNLRTAPPPQPQENHLDSSLAYVWVSGKRETRRMANITFKTKQG